jgi:transposase
VSEMKMRKTPTPDFKAKIGIEAIRGEKTIHQIAQEYGVHPVQVSQYKRLILTLACKLFEGKRGPIPRKEHGEPGRPHPEISASSHNGIRADAQLKPAALLS